MSDYITTVALINGEPTTVSFTRAFLESLFPESLPAAASEQKGPVTLEQLTEHFKTRSRN